MLQKVTVCQWEKCHKMFETSEKLRDHLLNDHIGRKSTSNLCLQCHWNNCGVVAVKRDHLASHIRVHLTLKPYLCSTCKKGFKRPQDLKKHEKIHTKEHQSSLLSKQPGYKLTRKGIRTNKAPSLNLSSQGSITSDSLSYDFLSPKRDSFDLSESPETHEYGDIISWEPHTDSEPAQILQNWLEQLSTNTKISEGTCPSILSGNKDEDYMVCYSSDKLYPKLDEPQLDLPKEINSSKDPTYKEPEWKIDPQFWSPEYITCSSQKEESPRLPSDSINFTNPVSLVETNSTFQTEHQLFRASTPTIDFFQRKKDLMHITNVFTSPGQYMKKEPTTTKEASARKIDENNVLYATYEQEISTCPYADLVSMLSVMEVKGE